MDRCIERIRALKMEDKAMTRDITITGSPSRDHAEWKVEEHNANAENDMAVFVGPNAERRAKAYAEWLPTNTRLVRRATAATKASATQADPILPTKADQIR
jgi:hypothetical protein